MIRCCEDNRRSRGGRSHSVAVDLAGWQELFDEVMGGSRAGFGRVVLRRRARAFVGGLLSDPPRKNCWTIAEHAGDPNPDWVYGANPGLWAELEARGIGYSSWWRP
jgi:hypothetical protein